MGFFGLLALCFDFLAEFVGLICLGTALFVGVGGYLSAILNAWLGLPMLLSIPLSTLGGLWFVRCFYFLASRCEAFTLPS